MNDESPQLLSEPVEVLLGQDELAALDGWRKANNDMSRPEAVRQLVRLGLLSEVGRIYQETTRGKNSSGV